MGTLPILFPVLTRIADKSLGAAEWNLFLSVIVWITYAVWLSVSGWAIQRRYFVEASLTPLKRNGVVWAAVLVGAVVLVGAQARPASPAVVSLTMMGTLLGYIDARTHRLPTPYVLALACGVLSGIGVTIYFHPQPYLLVAQVVFGTLIWTLPLWLGFLVGMLRSSDSWSRLSQLPARRCGKL